ncbi:hypothetical protein [uncultured Helicobacter sp.]|uniref:hypothetical protein n=2 Tax=uncultured Helicobacter sp. TaxID=175537 RepID=UPI0025D7D7CA|nr:hypothetical protein [uncultured Helicobacter sp.]
MSALDTFLTQPYDYEHFKDFIIESFGSKAQNIKTEQPHLYKAGNIIKSYAKLCEPILLESDELGIFAFETQSIDAKVTLHKELSSIIKNNALDMSAILAVFYDKNDKENFRLSLVTQGYDYNLNKPAFSNPRRFSFTLGENAKIKTAKEQLQKFINTKDKSLNTLQEAFSVEPVTKEFYAKYKGLYENLSQKLSANHVALNVLNGYEGLSETKAINAFVKKLLGRIVFLYFLQKKGWLGVPKDMPYGSGDKGFLYTTFQKSKEKNVSFYATYLCPLFFESLNTKHENDYSSLFESKIPFLNGGLFEAFTKQINGRKENMESSPFICEVLDNSDFEAIFDVFESYNFTIEESTPDNTEIGIDPEMLGKVFENLIDYKSKQGLFTRHEKLCILCVKMPSRALYKSDTPPHRSKKRLFTILSFTLKLMILSPKILLLLPTR